MVDPLPDSARSQEASGVPSPHARDRAAEASCALSHEIGVLPDREAQGQLGSTRLVAPTGALGVAVAGPPCSQASRRLDSGVLTTQRDSHHGDQSASSQRSLAQTAREPDGGGSGSGRRQCARVKNSRVMPPTNSTPISTPTPTV
jgi:hypothetical protein